MPAGKMRARLHFQKRSEEDDGFGSVTNTGPFVTVFEEYAELTARLGSEPVLASRLQGVQPYTIRIRSSDRAREIDATWRAVEGSVVYSIVSPAVNVDQKNAYLEMLATVGGTGQ